MRLCASAAVCSTIAALALAACGTGSDNGVASKSPEAIVSAASSAMARVSTVHVAGATNSGGSPTRIDLYLVNAKGGKGLMSQSGVSFKVLALNNEIYINGTATFWRRFGNSTAAQLLNGKWLKAPATGQFAMIAMLTNLRTLFNQLLSNHGTLAKGQTTTVRGHNVIAVKDTTTGATLYVATTGAPFPIEIVEGGSHGGQLHFDLYNQPVSLTAPTPTVDISQLK